MFFNKARAEEYMRCYRLDVLIATSPVNITYFSDYYCWLDPLIKGYMLQPGSVSSLALPGYAVFPLEGEPALVLNPLFAVNGADLWVRDIHIFGDSGVDATLTSDKLPEVYQRFHDLLLAPKSSSTSIDALSSILKARGVTEARIGLEMEGLTAKTHDEIRRALPQATILDCSSLILLIRMVKNEDEIKLLTRSAEINEQVGLDSLAQAWTGTSLAELTHNYRTRAAECDADFDHFSIGLRGLGLVTEPDYKLADDDVLFADFGCIYKGCFSDGGMTLTMRELTGPLMRRYNALHACIMAGMEAVRPGVKSSTVRGAMWQTLNEHGFTASYPHGHGIGLEVRDYPTIVADNELRISDGCIDVPSDLPLEENMVFNLESSMFMPGVASLHIEHSFVVTADGCRFLVPQNRRQPFLADFLSK